MWTCAAARAPRTQPDGRPCGSEARRPSSNEGQWPCCPPPLVLARSTSEAVVQSTTRVSTDVVTLWDWGKRCPQCCRRRETTTIQSTNMSLRAEDIPRGGSVVTAPVVLPHGGEVRVEIVK